MPFLRIFPLIYPPIGRKSSWRLYLAGKNSASHLLLILVTVTFSGRSLGRGFFRLFVVLHGGSVSALPATDPERVGFTFAGWATTPAGRTPFATSTPIEEATTAYAQWTFVGTPGEPVEFYLDLTNIATTQYAPAKATDWQWVPELATATQNPGGGVT